MWFRGAKRNRRVGREFVLDVKLRSSQVRAARARMAALAIGALFVSVAGLYLAWRASEAALNVLLYENKAFAIQEVDVQTDGVLAVDQLRRWSGVRLGQNLFALELEVVRRNLELISIVQSVSLEKIRPHTLRIRVLEREPLAQLCVPKPRAGGGIEMVPFYLDAEGYVILPPSPAQCAGGTSIQANEQLPLIAGLNGNEVRPGRRLESAQARAALQLLLAFESSPMQGLADIKRIDVSASEVLVAKTEQGSEVTFGLDDFDQQLRRWHAVFEVGQKVNKAIATLDLAVSNNIPALWLDTNAVPQFSTKAPKPPRNRKKHV